MTKKKNIAVKKKKVTAKKVSAARKATAARKRTVKSPILVKNLYTKQRQDFVQITTGELVESFQNDGFNEIAANKQAFSEILPKLRKELGNVYSNRLEWMAEMKKDPIHKIIETRKRFIQDDSFDTDEALTAAIKKRKFLLERKL